MEEFQPEPEGEGDDNRDRKWLVLIAILGVATLSLVFWLLPKGGPAKDKNLGTGGIPFAARPESAAGPKTEEVASGLHLNDQKVMFADGEGAASAEGAEEELSAADILSAMGADVSISSGIAKDLGAAMKADPEVHAALERFKHGGGKDVGGLLMELGNMPQFQAMLKKHKLDQKFGHGLGSDFNATGKGGGNKAQTGAQLLAEALKKYKGSGQGAGAGDYGDPGLGTRKNLRVRSSRQNRGGRDAHEVGAGLNKSQWQARLSAAGTQESQAYDFGFSLDAWAAISAPNREVLKTIETEGHNQPGPPAPSVATCSGTWCRLVSCGKGCVTCQPKYPFGGNGGAGCGGPTWDYNQNHDNVKAVCKFFGFEDDCKQACLDHPPCDMWAFKDKEIVNNEHTPGGDGGDGGPTGGETVEETGEDNIPGVHRGPNGECFVPCDFAGDPPRGCQKDPTCPQ